MVRKLIFFGLLAGLTGASALGCHRNAVQPKPQVDPLVSTGGNGVAVQVKNKSQVTGQAGDNRDATSQAYPQPPAFPDTPTAIPASRLVPLQAYKD
jgi:hypothetical protein